MMFPSSSEEIEASSDLNYDRQSELRAFDATKAGVKGLVDAGITKVPRIFLHPPENLKDVGTPMAAQFDLPVIDLGGLERLAEIVDRVRDAAETWGFMQVVNHGIPVRVLEAILEGFRRFMEQDAEVKKQYYTRDVNKRCRLNTNFDLFTAPTANWRDSLYYFVAPNPPPPQQLPQLCREVMIEYSKEVMGLGRRLFELLSEGLGLSRDHLLEMECADSLLMISHYYPACPQPELTLGTTRHSDN